MSKYIFSAATKHLTKHLTISSESTSVDQNIRARENQMKKTHVRQLTLKNIHAMA